MPTPSPGTQICDAINDLYRHEWHLMINLFQPSVKLVRKVRVGSWLQRLRTSLVEAAQAASRAKKTYLAAQYHRLIARRGRKKAFVAVAHSMLVIAYHLLARGECYKDLGPTYFDQREQYAVEGRLTRRLERLGYRVVPEQVA
jgi:hypothetical protein